MWVCGCDFYEGKAKRWRKCERDQTKQRLFQLSRLLLFQTRSTVQLFRWPYRRQPETLLDLQEMKRQWKKCKKMKQNTLVHKMPTSIEIRWMKGETPLVLVATLLIYKSTHKRYWIGYLECFDDGLFCSDAIFNFNFNKAQMWVNVLQPTSRKNWIFKKMNARATKCKITVITPLGI